MDLFIPTSILQTQKSNMMEQTCLSRSFCSFTGFLPNLPKSMSANCINICHLGNCMPTKFLKTDYLQTFMSSLSIFCVGILVWASKFCSELVKNSQEKISFRKTLEDKVLIAIVTKHCCTFNFTRPFF